MNDEIDEAIRGIRENIARYEILDIKDGVWDEKTKLAKSLQFQLTMLKLMVGLQNFDELSYFRSWLKKVDAYVDKADREYDDVIQGVQEPAFKEVML